MWLKRSQGSEVKMRQLKSSGSLPAGLALLLAGPEARRGLLKVKGEDAGEVGRRAKELHHWRKKERKTRRRRERNCSVRVTLQKKSYLRKEGRRTRS